MAQQAQHERSRLGALVGRARELDELGAALDRLADGEPWMLQLAGEPGIGKSRLLAELRGRAVRRGYLVLDGRAAEFELDVPFGLILDALNDYLARAAAESGFFMDAGPVDADDRRAPAGGCRPGAGWSLGR